MKPRKPKKRDRADVQKLFDLAVDASLLLDTSEPNAPITEKLDKFLNELIEKGWK